MKFASARRLLQIVFVVSSIITTHQAIAGSKGKACNSNYYKITFANEAESRFVLFASIPEKFEKNLAKFESKDDALDVYRYQLKDDQKPIVWTALDYVGTATYIANKDIGIKLISQQRDLLASSENFVNAEPQKRYAFAFFKKNEKRSDTASLLKDADQLKRIFQKELIFAAAPIAQGQTQGKEFSARECFCSGFFGGKTCCTPAPCAVEAGVWCQDNGNCRENGTCWEPTFCSC